MMRIQSITSKLLAKPSVVISYRYVRTVKGIYRRPKLMPDESKEAVLVDTLQQAPSSFEIAPIRQGTISQIDTQGKNNASTWSWIPPIKQDGPKKLIEKNKLEIKTGVYLSAEEVKAYLESNGAEEVIVLPLKQPLDTIKSFVIGSASSSRLIRRLLEAVVDNLKKRELHRVIGASGIEGDKTDDWQLVDCHNFLVHMMLPETRKHLDLEGHWSMDERPSLPYAKDERDLSKKMDALLDKYPCPEEYAISMQDSKRGKREGEIKIL